jgi:glycosyltransferase involved in cell wall biosynthesis
MHNPTTNIKVSVCVVTYNHEKYLAEALDSILMQEVDFPIEIEIGEDRSADKTLAICREYEKKYPGIIRLHVNEKNLGYNWNFYRTMERCQGEYVAVLDGDDFWTDPLKLKKQIEFLDKHSEYAMCFSKYYVCDENSRLGPATGFSGHYNLNDVLAGKCPGTRTVVFRREYLPASMPALYDQISYADHILLALIVQHGQIYGLDEPLAAYRMNPESIYTSNTMETRSLNIIRNYQLMKKVFPEKEQQKAIDTGIINERLKLERLYFFTCRPLKFIRNSVRIFLYDIRNLKTTLFKSWFIIFKTGLKVLFGKTTLKQAKA